jgi:hypothetical protein
MGAVLPKRTNAALAHWLDRNIDPALIKTAANVKTARTDGGGRSFKRSGDAKKSRNPQRSWGPFPGNASTQTRP